ncbi:MAG: hypothetical protein ACOVLB_04385, partial [Candidatus Nanopelagicus sp.]
QNMSLAKIGKPKSDRHSENISIALTGKKRGKYKPRTSPNKAKGIKKGPRSKQSVDKQKLSITGVPLGPQKLVECPFCKKVGGISLMKRFHFINCKLKENSDNRL